MKQLRCLTVCIVFAAIVTVSAGQPSINFTGTWKMDLAKSNAYGSSAPTSWLLTVRHDVQSVRTVSAQTLQQREVIISSSYATDGRETTNSGGGNEFKSRATWDGDELVIENIGHDVTLRDYWSLSKDGQILTIRRHARLGSRFADQKYIFERQPTSDTLPANNSSPSEIEPLVSGGSGRAAQSGGSTSADRLDTSVIAESLNGWWGRDHYVRLLDIEKPFSAQSWREALNGRTSRSAEITMFMPEAVLSIQSEAARRQFVQYVPTDEDLRRSITIIAEGYVPADARLACDSITRVILLSDTSGHVVEEPYLSEPLAETWRNAFGVTNQCQALRVKFSMISVERVKAAAPGGEFLVGEFAGNAFSKMYKIKKKHQSRLGLLLLH